ncbi:mechanosensitive ion channel family protein, partial [Streptomyces coelicoflavus]
MSHTLPPAEPATTPQLAASWSDWIGDHTTSLIGIPLRIALIVVILLVLRAVAKRAITRVVQRVLEPSAGEAEQSRPRRQARGAAVLH